MGKCAILTGSLVWSSPLLTSSSTITKMDDMTHMTPETPILPTDAPTIHATKGLELAASDPNASVVVTVSVPSEAIGIHFDPDDGCIYLTVTHSDNGVTLLAVAGFSPYQEQALAVFYLAAEDLARDRPGVLDLDLAPTVDGYTITGGTYTNLEGSRTQVGGL